MVIVPVNAVQPWKVEVMFVTLAGITGAVVRDVQLTKVYCMFVTRLGITRPDKSVRPEQP